MNPKFLLATFVVLLAGLAYGSAGCVFGPAGHGTFEKTLIVKDPVQIEIEAGSGEVRISRGPGGSVRVGGEFEVFARLDENTSDRVENIKKNPPVTQDGSIIRIGQDRELLRNVRVNYTITVPEESEVRGEIGSGNFYVQSIKGPVHLRAGSGSLNVDAISGGAELRSGSGSQRLRNIGGAVRAEANSGELSIENVRGDIRASTGSGRISVAQPGGGITVEARSGDIRIRDAKFDVRAEAGSGRISVSGSPRETFDWHIQTRSGSVEVDLPEAAGFRLDARTTSGSFHLDRSLEVQEKTRKLLRARAGDGLGRVSVETGSGSVRIR
jgi:DUF4097 and DUF4098 domain-containing protein YvlB